MNSDIEKPVQRKIIGVTRGEPYPLRIADLHDKKILRIWTIFDIQQFNSEQQDLQSLPLVHNQNAYLEDKNHDWTIKDDFLFYYSRIVEKGAVASLLIEYIF